MEKRIRALEAQVRAIGCATCRDWPTLVVAIEPEAAHPGQCPACGRDATHVIRIVQRDDGPQ